MQGQGQPCSAKLHLKDNSRLLQKGEVTTFSYLYTAKTICLMKLPGFRLPSNQQFSYKPRYWDPKEEERRERDERLQRIANNDVEAMKTRISGTFKHGGTSGGYTGSYRNRQMAKSNFVLIAVIASLLFLSYLLLVVYLPRLEAMLS